MNQIQSSKSSVVSQSPGESRHVHTLRRRVGFALVALLGFGVIIALSGFGHEKLAAAGDEERYPPPGQLVDVNGHLMHIYCSGEGNTTVILDAGLSGASLDWNLVQPAIGETTRVCSYDRAGMGWSEPSPEPRTPEQIARELHLLLTNAGISPPYVLVGHSLAGKNIRMFAAQHPDEVVGMVLVDARGEYVDAMASQDEVNAFRNASRMQGTAYRLARKLGVARLIGGNLLGLPSSMSAETRRTMALLTTKGSAITASTAEAFERASSDSALEAAPSLGNRPLLVLASSQNMGGLAFWPEGQRAQADLSTAGRLVVVGSGHYIHWEHPEVVIDAIREVLTMSQITAVREKSRSH